MELVLLNPRLAASQALSLGLINGVVPDSALDEEVMRIARHIASGPATALGIAKQLVNRAAAVEQLDLHLDEELQQLTRIADGAEFAEGLTAFFEKREAAFESVTDTPPTVRPDERR